MRQLLKILLLIFISAGLVGFVQPASAQLGGLKKKVKSKVEKKAEEKVDEKIDETIDNAAGDGEKKTDEKKDTKETADAKESESCAPAAQAKGGSATAEDMNLYTKYDFIPGDKVIFYDDLANEELGEFPSRWKLDERRVRDCQAVRPELDHVHERGRPGAEGSRWTVAPQVHSRDGLLCKR